MTRQIKYDRIFTEYVFLKDHHHIHCEACHSEYFIKADNGTGIVNMQCAACGALYQAVEEGKE